MKKTTFEKIFNYVKLFTLFSIFTGIIYQYISIKGNISFFSYSEVINDSILAIPMVMIYLLSFYISYNYIYFYIKETKKYKLGKFLSTLFGVVINVGIALFMYKYILFEINIIMTNNVTALFVLLLLFLIVIINIGLHLYIIFFDKKIIKRLYIGFGIIIYITTLSIINDSMYKNLCTVINNKNIHINYLNDKFIFIDNGNVIKIDEVEGFLRKENCIVIINEIIINKDIDNNNNNNNNKLLSNKVDLDKSIENNTKGKPFNIKEIFIQIFLYMFAGLIGFLSSYWLFLQQNKKEKIKMQRSIISSLEGINIIRSFWLISKFTSLVYCEYYDLLTQINGANKKYSEEQLLLNQNNLSNNTGKLFEIHKVFIEKVSLISLYFEETDELNNLIEDNVNMKDIKMHTGFNKNMTYKVIRTKKDEYLVLLKEEIDIKFSDSANKLVQYLKSTL